MKNGWKEEKVSFYDMFLNIFSNYTRIIFIILELFEYLYYSGT